MGRRVVNSTSTTPFEEVKMITSMVMGAEPTTRVSRLSRLDSEYVLLIPSTAAMKSGKEEGKQEAMVAMKSSGIRHNERTCVGDGSGICIFVRIRLSCVMHSAVRSQLQFCTLPELGNLLGQFTCLALMHEFLQPCYYLSLASSQLLVG